MLFESILEIYHPGNYKCNLIPLTFSNIKVRQSITFKYNRESLYATYDYDKHLCTTQMYIVEDLINKKCYWAQLSIVNDYYTKNNRIGHVYFKLVSSNININNIESTSLHESYHFIIQEYNSYKYAIYKPSVYFCKIPSRYKIIMSDKKHWNELCDIIINNNILVPISRLINIYDLRNYIITFL
jgi:hypothetical protein